MEFGGVVLTAERAEWMLAQLRTCGEFGPTPIQQCALRPLLAGRSAALSAPTGTGKTLAYLLPLLERYTSRGPAEGRPVLVVVPTEDLQLQVGGVAQALAGKDADRVGVPRYGVLFSREQLGRMKVLVVTPSQLGKCFKLDGWPDFCTSLGAVVVDEADAMLRRGDSRVWPLGDLLNDLASEARDAPPQLVLASASMSLEAASAIATSMETNVQMISAGASFVEDEEEVPELWPRAVRHFLVEWPPVPKEQDEWLERTMFRKRDKTLRQKAFTRAVLGTIRGIKPEPQRCLVIVAEKLRTSERPDSTGKLCKRLREALGPIGYDVAVASTVVEAASGAAAPDLVAKLDKPTSALAKAAGKQVVVSRAESIRGIDIADIDAVIIVGKVGEVDDYRHLAGRTGRCKPGRNEGGVEGTVVSILESRGSRTMRKWSLQEGFELEDMKFSLEPPWAVPGAPPRSQESQFEDQEAGYREFPQDAGRRPAPGYMQESPQEAAWREELEGSETEQVPGQRRQRRPARPWEQQGHDSDWDPRDRRRRERRQEKMRRQNARENWKRDGAAQGRDDLNEIMLPGEYQRGQ